MIEHILGDLILVVMKDFFNYRKMIEHILGGLVLVVMKGIFRGAIGVLICRLVKHWMFEK